MSTEIASAYVALHAKMPGVKTDISSALGGSDVRGVFDKHGTTLGNVLAGAVGGAIALGMQKAMSAVTNAVDAAITRVDTMNNFPKIMANLGYSSEDAARSIQTMSDRLTGLPTALDTMAGVVQKLAPLTNGLDEATELSLALNNALLAGGKSTEIQANAMEQYTQMLAVGKVDMAAWRSMVSAMPGQMNQLAESLLGAGKNSMDLYEAMKDGTITFDDFNAAILQLNKEGTGAYASFEQQARSATEGIATSQANLGTAITRGLANLIAKFQPQIVAILGGITQFVNDAFKAIGEFVDWVGQNKDWLTPLAIGVGVLAAGFTALSIASSIAAAGGLVAFIKSIDAAKAAMAAFNLVVDANPIMRIVTVIAAVVAALVWFFTQTELGREIWENVTNAIATAATWLWESVLQPTFTAIGEIFTWLFENIIQPVFEGIAAAFTWIYESIILPVITGIMLYIGLWAALFEWLWNAAVKPVIDFLAAAFKWLYETIIKPVIDAIGAAFRWVYETFIKPIVDLVVFAIQNWGAIMDWLYRSSVKPIFDAIGAVFNWFYQVIVKPVFDAVAAAFNWIWTSVIKPVADFISNAIRTVGDTIHNVFSGIAGFIGAAFQAVLGVVRGPINALIDMINSVIGALNSISVTIPDWVPIVGGQRFGLSIPKIPRLAQGAVVRGTSAGTLAVIGEGGPGRDEAVVPLPDGWRQNGLGGTSRIAHEDMQMLAVMVAEALRDVRRADGVSAQRATMQGVR